MSPTLEIAIIPFVSGSSIPIMAQSLRSESDYSAQKARSPCLLTPGRRRAICLYSVFAVTSSTRTTLYRLPYYLCHLLVASILVRIWQAWFSVPYSILSSRISSVTPWWTMPLWTTPLWRSGAGCSSQRQDHTIDSETGRVSISDRRVDQKTWRRTGSS